MEKSPVPVFGFDAYPQVIAPQPPQPPTEALEQLVVYRREERFATCRQHVELHRRAFYKLSLIGEGGGLFTLNDEVVAVGPQSLLLVPPGTALSWQLSAGPQTGLYCFFSPDFYNAGLLPGYQLQAAVLSGGAPYVHHTATPAEYAALRASGEQLLAQQQHLAKARHHLRLLLADARQWQSPTAATLPPAVQQFLQLLDARLATATGPVLALETYAAALCITPKQLSALCRQALGQSAANLLKERVATEARVLLTGTPLPISDIAYQLSFYDVAHFSRWFRQAVGQAPSAYRAQFSASK